VPIERPQINAAGGAASRAARVQEPIAGGDGRLDRWREQQGHVRRLSGIPYLNEFYRIVEDLWPKRAPRSRILLRSLAAPVLHFALVKAHGRASMSASRTGLKGPLMSFVLILQFVLNGHVHTVNIGRAFSSQLECSVAGQQAKSYANLAPGERYSFSCRPK
jgi:hypothetical protein